MTQSMFELIQSFGAFAGGTDNHETARIAEEWHNELTVDEANAWLGARCFTPAGAMACQLVGITAEQAKTKTRLGLGDYVDTVGYKVANNDLGANEWAQKIQRRQEG